MTRYDEPEEYYDEVPEKEEVVERVKNTRGSNFKQKLNGVAGLSRKVAREFDPILFKTRNPTLVDDVSLATGPVVLLRDGRRVKRQENRARLEGLAAFLVVERNLYVRIVDMWELIDACVNGDVAAKKLWVEYAGSDNTAIIFNDMYTLQEDLPPWYDDHLLTAKAHALFRAMHSRGGNLFMVVDDSKLIATEFFDHMSVWWGNDVAYSMEYESVKIEL